MLSVVGSRPPLTSVALTFPAKHRAVTFSPLERNPVYLRPSASEKEESQVEVDREKALEALEKLDRQLESFVQKESASRNRPSSSYPGLDVREDLRMRMRRTEELPEISPSFLAYSAGFLIILTIVNNIIFNVYVKPSVDGVDQRGSASERVALTDPSG